MVCTPEAFTYSQLSGSDAKGQTGSGIHRYPVRCKRALLPFGHLAGLQW